MIVIRILKQVLFKQGIRPLLILVQLTIGFAALGVGLGIVEGSQQFISKVTQVAPQDTIGFVTYQSSSTVTNEQLIKMYHSLLNDPQIKQVGTILTNITSIPEIQNMDYLQSRSANDSGQSIPSGNVMIGFVDEPYLKMENFPVSSGRSLSENDFTTNTIDEIPILIGSRLAKQVPLGARLTSGVLDSKKMTIVPKTFKVVGVLQDHFKMWQGGDCLECSFLEDDAMILAPIQAEQETGVDLKTRVSSNLQIRLKPGVDVAKFRTQFESQMASIDLPGHTRSVQEDIQYYQKEHREQILFSLSFAFLLLFLASFGLLGVILVSIVRRKQEFGIRFAMGATPKSLGFLVVSEVFILTFLSGVFGVMCTVLISMIQSSTLPIHVGLETCLLTLGVIFIASSIAALLPMVRVMQLEPITLIREGA